MVAWAVTFYVQGRYCMALVELGYLWGDLYVWILFKSCSILHCASTFLLLARLCVEDTSHLGVPLNHWSSCSFQEPGTPAEGT